MENLRYCIEKPYVLWSDPPTLARYRQTLDIVESGGN